MEQHFNTPSEVIDTNMKAGEGKAHLPLGKMILLGIMAGAFIALGGATSSTAAHAIDNVGLARFVAGIIFPVGLMIIVFVGGELFTMIISHGCGRQKGDLVRMYPQSDRGLLQQSDRCVDH